MAKHEFVPTEITTIRQLICGHCLHFHSQDRREVPQLGLERGCIVKDKTKATSFSCAQQIGISWLSNKDPIFPKQQVQPQPVPQATPSMGKQRIAEGVCPNCQATLWFEEGCYHCPSCGFEKC